MISAACSSGAPHTCLSPQTPNYTLLAMETQYYLQNQLDVLIPAPECSLNLNQNEWIDLIHEFTDGMDLFKYMT
jgi:hypothetical protein